MLLYEIRKKEAIKKLEDKLNAAEAFQFSYIGSQYDKGKRNQQSYKNWRRMLMKQIESLEGRKQNKPNFWDNLGKKSRKF